MLKYQLKYATFWSILGLILRVILGFIIAPFFISKVGLEGYGIFLFLNMLSYNGFTQILDLGLPLAIQKRQSDIFYKENNLKLSFVLIVLMAITSYFILLTILVYYPNLISLGKYFEDLRKSVHLFGALVLVQFLSSFYNSILLAQTKVIFVKKWETLLNIFWVLWGYFTVLIFLQNYLFYFIFGNFIANLLYLYFCIKETKYDMINILKKEKIILKNNNLFFNTWKSSFLLKLNGLTFKQTDSIIVSILLTPASLSILDISTKLMSLCKTLLGKLNEVSFVLFNNQNINANKIRSEEIFIKILNLQLLITIVFTYFIFFCSKEFLDIWLGKTLSLKIISYTQLTGIILITIPYVFHMSNYLISIDKKFSKTVKILGLISVLSIAISTTLTFYFEILGVLIGTLVQHLMIIYYLFKQLQIDRIKTAYHLKLVKILVIFVVMTGQIYSYLAINVQVNEYLRLIIKMTFFMLSYFLLLKHLYKKNRVLSETIDSINRLRKI